MSWKIYKYALRVELVLYRRLQTWPYAARAALCFFVALRSFLILTAKSWGQARAQVKQSEKLARTNRTAEQARKTRA